MGDKLYQNKEWLEIQYITLKKSSLKIAKECKCGKTTILRWLEKFKITRRTTSEALKGRISWIKGKHHSKETKLKISKANKGKLTGDKNPSKRSEVQKKISEGLKGKLKSEEHKKKLSESMMGHLGWNKGKKYPQTTGDKHYRWKGEKTQTSNGYILIYKPDHPFHSKTKYVYEHRLMMEEKLGRYLEHEEQVHHINEIKNDNRIENLYLCNNYSDHTKLHKQIERIALELFRSEKFGKIKFDCDIGEYYLKFERGK